jgi:hypothetical protein
MGRHYVKLLLVGFLIIGACLAYVIRNDVRLRTDKKGAIQPRAPELQVSDFLLEPRSNVEAVLGPPIKPAADCSDTIGQQYEYRDGSYICAENERVILVSYRLKLPVATPAAAMRATGLRADVSPVELNAGIHKWSVETQNPIIVKGSPARLVIAYAGAVSRVEVDMTGGVPVDFTFVAGGYSNEPFSLAASQLPPRYKGVNLISLFGALLDLQIDNRKDEFETSKQFKERVQNLNAKTILGSLRMDSVYAFSIDPPSYVGMPHGLRQMEYDADHGSLRIFFSSDYCCSLGGSHFGTNEAFRWKELAGLSNDNKSSWNGLVIRNLHDFPIQTVYGTSVIPISISASPEEAKKLKQRIKVLLIGKLEKPFISFQSGDPTSYSFVHVRLAEIRVYDPGSGRVYSKLSARRH